MNTRKVKTNVSVRNNLGIKVTSNMHLGKSGSYSSGDILDANATEELFSAAKIAVDNRFDELIGGAPEALDTLKELADGLKDSDDAIAVITNTLSTKANKDDVYTKEESDEKYIQEHQSLAEYAKTEDVPTKVSDLTNDVGYTTNIGTITGITMNGSSKGTSGVIDLGTVITEHQSLAKYATLEQLNEAMEAISTGGYGICWADGETPKRIGNMVMHTELPIQSAMRRCILKDDGTVNGYISSTNYKKYIDGRDVDYTGGDGQFMVEIPEYDYEAFDYWDEANSKYIHYLILYPYGGRGKKSKKYYFGAVEASSNDADGSASTKKLFSICTANYTESNNTVSSSSITYSSNAENYAGGASNSLYGCAKTNLTRNDFRTRAAARGAGWSQQYWAALQSVIRLYVVEYCSFNMQAAWTPTADGVLKQGGLGGLISSVGNWSDINGYNPLVPCGVTRHLGNKSGVVSYTRGNITMSVPSYRGIENPAGHIWKFTDGFNIQVTDGTCKFYTCEDVTKFADNTASNYGLRCSIAGLTSGYIGSCNWDENGDFIPKATNGSSVSGMYDYSWYSSNGLHILISGGTAAYGAFCGWFCFYGAYGSGLAHASVGGRLCYTPA